ncbi:MAG: hypothetical protein MJ126_05810 [Lachnospiraceae bacterium]|nr:hypothetical protein [Lachnospiraceae bacterium]
MSNPSWCNNCEECNLIYHYCYTPYIDSNYEYCEHCNVEEYRFNNDEGYRCKIFEKALRSACEDISHCIPISEHEIKASGSFINAHMNRYIKEAREVND